MFFKADINAENALEQVKCFRQELAIPFTGFVDEVDEINLDDRKDISSFAVYEPRTSSPPSFTPPSLHQPPEIPRYPGWRR